MGFVASTAAQDLARGRHRRPGARRALGHTREPERRGGRDMSLLEQEIHEQPEVAARLLDAVLPRLGELHDLLRSHGAEQVLLVARGSSDNAARYAQYLWQLRARTTVTLATP